VRDPVTTELSCYTAPLAGYLAGEYPDPVATLAATLRLAVLPDPAGPAFSHHGTPAGRLADGRCLRYRTAPAAADATRALAARVARDGRAIVVTRLGALPWSVGHPAAAATHWLLVDGFRDDGTWHVTDDFSGLLPAGPQDPYAGWVGGDTLAAAMSAPRSTSAAQVSRDRYALGPALAPPTGTAWLEPGPPRGAEPGPEPGWLTGLDALDWLGGWLAAAGAGAAPWLDDVWTVARHYRYRLNWLVKTRDIAPGAAAAAGGAWRTLPMALRYAIDSARRGRPRPSLVARAVGAVTDAEKEAGVWAG
jgi:hypothetical protein